MAKNRERQRRNRKIKQELKTLGKTNQEKYQVPTEYAAERKAISEQFIKPGRGKEQP